MSCRFSASVFFSASKSLILYVEITSQSASLHSLISVSYTHLDVYKRQILKHGIRRIIRIPCNGTSAQKEDPGNQDVYKRQQFLQHQEREGRSHSYPVFFRQLHK